MRGLGFVGVPHEDEVRAAVEALDGSALQGRALVVSQARPRQLARFAGSGVPHNAAMGVRAIRQYCQLDAGGERLLEQAMQRFGLGASAHFRIREVVGTIADLAGEHEIGIEHLSEAVQCVLGSAQIRWVQVPLTPG